MKILGNFNIGKTGLLAATTSLAMLTSAPVINAKPQLRTDTFERTVNSNGQVEIIESKTIIKNKPETKPKDKQTTQTRTLDTNKNTVTPAITETPKVEKAEKPQRTNQTQKVTSTTSVPPKGTTDPEVLAKAPSPQTTIMGKRRTATIVIDLSTNVLYKYDKDGNPEIAYRVASGKKSTPTDEGIRLVTHTETYPYKTAPAATKRRQNPQDYGPKLIHLTMIDPKTGKKWDNGEYIHGNNKASSIGKYASKGCVRMDNEVIQILAKQVKNGDVVIMKKY